MAPRIRHNLLANIFGKGWSAIISLAFVPIYIKFLGIEAYGVIGLFTTLLVLSSLFDFGLSTTLMREISRFSGDKSNPNEIRSLTFTLEVIYWSLAFVILLLLLLLVPLISNYWIKPQSLEVSVIQYALLMISVAVAMQFPFTLYSNGMFGLEQQVAFNVLFASMSTVRAIGAVLLLWLLEPTLQVFLSWQILVSLMQSVILRSFLWHYLPNGTASRRFEFSLVLRVWKFAAGMGIAGILAIVITQIDKIMLSKLLPLSEFGYYVFANSITLAMLVISTTFYSSLFPRFSQLVKNNNEAELINLYHCSSQLLAVVIIPLSCVIAVFSFQILMLWTGDEALSNNTYILVKLLVIGSALNSLVFIPYALQIAYGWTKLSIWQNFIAIIVLVPLMFILTKHYGAKGAAFVWVILNSGYLIVSVPIMHLKLLPAEKWRWYRSTIVLPLMATIGSIGLYKLINLKMESNFSILFQITAVLITTWCFAALATPYTRQLSINYVMGKLGH